MKQKIMSAILTCILGIFLSCNININGEVAKKKFIVTFAIEGEGTIIATIDGNKVDASVVAEEGTIIELKASFDEQKYEIERWVGAKENTFDKTRAKLEVSENITVGLVLKDKKPIEVSISFTAGEHGRIKAMVGDRELHSGDTLTKDSIVKFEAIPDDDYEVSSWSGARASDENKNYATAVAKTDLNVSVVFKLVYPGDKLIKEKKSL